MAGYRVGELYASLHAEVMRMVEQHPVQGEGRRDLLEGAMRLRYSVLVQKALRMMQQTLDMAERVGESSGWVDKTRQTKAALLRWAQAEEDAIAKLPYSRESLSYALERLRAEASGGGTPK
jgi:type III secretory pathway component EscV